MTQDYYTMITNAGLNKEVLSYEEGATALQLTEIALGDGNGEEYDPDGSETALKNESYRTTINKIEIDPINSSHVIIEASVPADVGAFFVREIGVFDSDGDLFAICKYKTAYKSVAVEGLAKVLHIKIILQFTNTPNVNMTIDPNIILCTEARAISLIGDLQTNIITNYALKDLSNVLKSSITDKGIATTDLDNLTANANSSTTKKGIVELATLTEGRTGTDTSRAITPHILKTLIDENNTYQEEYIKGGIARISKDVFVAMTSSQLPIGEMSWCSSLLGGVNDWCAFDKNINTDWHSANNASLSTTKEYLLRKMSVNVPLKKIFITSRDDGVSHYAPTSFDIVYTTDVMPFNGGADSTIRDLNYIVVKSLTGQSWGVSETKDYELDSEIPVNATAWGIRVSESSTGGDYVVIARMDGYDLTNKQVELSNFKARNISNTQDIKIPIGILNLLSASNYADGIGQNIFSIIKQNINMTSNNTNGWIATSDNGSANIYKVFDGSGSSKFDGSHQASTSNPVIITLQAPTPYVANQVRITSDENSGEFPINYIIQGSNNGTDWDDLLVKTGDSFSGAYQQKTYNFENETAYTHYRFYCTHSDPTNFELGEIEFWYVPNSIFYIWADYNNTRFVFDDYFGSHISGVKRKVGGILIDSSGNIIKFISWEKASGGVITLYLTPIQFASPVGDSIATFDIPAPLGVYPIYQFTVSGYYDSNGSPYVNYLLDGNQHIICYAPAEGSYSQTGDSNIVSHFLNDTGSITLKYKTRQRAFVVQGYIDERIN